MSSLRLVPVTTSNAAIHQIGNSTRSARRRRQRQRRAARPSSQKTLVLSAVPQQTTSVVTAAVGNRRRRRTRRVRGIGSPMVTQPVAAYRRTLEDPFEYPGVKLGFGTMTPTTLGALYVRQSFTANADGSFEICVHPNAAANGFAFTSNSGAATTPTWTGNSASNGTAVTSAFTVGRVVSMGLRARVLQAQTAAPGILAGYANQSIEVGNTPLLATTPNGFYGIPNVHLAYGSETIEVLWRPRGPEDFDFASMGVTTAGCFGSGGLYVSGTGFPASVTVFYEAILHFEAQLGTPSISNPSDISDAGYGSLGNLFDTVAAAGRIIASLGPEVRSTIQQSFGLNAGLRGIFSGSRTGQVTIEEMKEF